MHSNYNILENYNSQKIQNSYNSPTGAPVNDSEVGNPLQCHIRGNPESGDNCNRNQVYYPNRVIQQCPPACPHCVIMHGAAVNQGPDLLPMGYYTDPATGISHQQYLEPGESPGKCISRGRHRHRPNLIVTGNRDPTWMSALANCPQPLEKQANLQSIGESSVGDRCSGGGGGLTIAGSANAICSNFKDEFVYWQNQYQTIMSQGWQPELNASVGLPSTGGVNKMCLLHQEGEEQTASCDGLDKQIFLQTARLNMAFARDNFEQCTRMVRDKSPVCSNASVAPLLCTTDRDSSLNLVQQSGTGGTQIALKTDDIKKIADGGNRPVATINKEHGWWGVPPLSGPATTAAPNQSRASINNYGGGILLPSAVRRCHK